MLLASKKQFIYLSGVRHEMKIDLSSYTSTYRPQYFICIWISLYRRELMIICLNFQNIENRLLLVRIWSMYQLDNHLHKSFGASWQLTNKLTGY